MNCSSREKEAVSPLSRSERSRRPTPAVLQQIVQNHTPDLHQLEVRTGSHLRTRELHQTLEEPDEVELRVESDSGNVIVRKLENQHIQTLYINQRNIRSMLRQFLCQIDQRKIHQ